MITSASHSLETGVQYDISAVRNLMRASFTAQDLQRFCRDSPTFRPMLSHFALNPSLEDMIDVLVERSQRQDLLPELLAGIEQANPRQYDKHRAQIMSEGVPLDQVPRAGQQPSRRVGQGLMALAELMRTPEVRTAVVAFRTDFQAAQKQVDLLSNYKYLHDLLHHLQFHCYNPIVQEARRFPDDDVAVDSLMDHELTLQRVIGDLQDVASRAALPEGETLWIGDLVRAQESLAAAIDELDAKLLKRAIWHLNRVLTTQPSLINTRLNAAARALRLPELVEEMSRLSDSLVQLDTEPARVRQFQAGVTALADLDDSLASIVDDHDCWQVVDIELRQIESGMGQESEAVEMSWPYLKVKAEPLYRDREESWAVSLKQVSDHLDGALEVQHPVRIRRFFRLFRRQAGERFYRVDLALKELCEDLQRVGEPLALVMRMTT
jgi:hypothetical protein